MGVVVLYMGTFLCKWSAIVDAAILIDYDMIAAALPSAFAMPSVDVLDGDTLRYFRGGAVDDDKRDFAVSLFERFHGLWIYSGNGSPILLMSH